MTAPAPHRIAILGFGLIGGSVARALSAARDAATDGASSGPAISAWSPSGGGPSRAAGEGIIDVAAGSLELALADADLVIIAAPPLETIALIGRIGSRVEALAERAVVTDATSTKAAVMEAGAIAGLRFVGGHPMAGTEASGYGSSSADLFRDRPWVITPPVEPDTEAVATVHWLARTCGAIPIELTADQHDEATAAISHLPLVASVALAEAVAGEIEGSGTAPTWEVARHLTAGGWASMTRLARGDVHMGTGIAVTNASAIATQLRRYREVLDAWLATLEDAAGPDVAVIERRLRHAKALLEDHPPVAAAPPSTPEP